MLFCLAAHYTYAQQDSILTYEQAVNIALKENIQIRQQENILNTEQTQNAQSYAAFAPSVNASADAYRVYGRQFDNTVAEFTQQRTNQLSGGIYASINLFNSFGKINRVKQTGYAAEAQRQLIQETRQEVVFNVSQQYLQVLLNQELLRIAKSNQEQQEELLESTTIFVEEGIRNIADQYNQDAEAKNAVLLAVEAENKLAISKVQLIRTLQIDPFKQWKFAQPEISKDEVFSDIPDIASMYNQAIGNRPEIKKQHNVIQSNHYGIRVARATYAPSLDMIYQLSSRYSNLSPLPLRDQLLNVNKSNVIGFSLNIPIFSGLQNRVLVQRSRQLYDNATLDMEDMERNIFEQLQTAAADFRAAQERIVAAKAREKAAEKAVEAEKERFKLGVGNILDLNLVNAKYVEAQSQKVQADYTLIFQKTALDYYTGELQPGNLTLK